MKLKLSPLFLRKAKRLLKSNPQLRDQIETALEELQEDPFQPKLKTHRLNGDLQRYWSSKAGYDLRIVFKIVAEDGENLIYLHTIGTHDDVY